MQKMCEIGKFWTLGRHYLTFSEKFGQLTRNRLGFTQYILMIALEERGETHYSDLAVVTGTSFSTTRDMVLSLQERGYIKTSHPVGQKKAHVRLTPSGRLILEEARIIETRFSRSVLATVGSPEEQELFLDALWRIGEMCNKPAKARLFR